MNIEPGSTPIHPDEQLERLAEYYRAFMWPWLNVSFRKFACSPVMYGYPCVLHEYRLVRGNNSQRAGY